METFSIVKKVRLSLQNRFFQKFPWCSQIGISYDGYKIDMAIYTMHLLKVHADTPKHTNIRVHVHR